MGNSAVKVAPQINLDEFERRLRAAGSSTSAPEDPLDQLARLVSLDVSTPVAANRPLVVKPKAEAPQIRLPHIDDALEVSATPTEQPRAENSTAQEPLALAPLRGSIAPAPAVLAKPVVTSEEPAAEAQDQDDRAEVAPSARRSRRTPLVMGLLVTVGAVALVGAWAIKGAPGLPRTPPVIMAADGPTKVQPPSEDTVSSPGDSASILTREQPGKQAPVKVVSNEEQPVDLQQEANTHPATRSIAPISAEVPAQPQTSAPAPTVAPASAPVVALTTVGPTNAAPAAPAAFPEPKRVKTVSVRPDGSLISSAAAPVAEAPVAASAPAPAPAASTSSISTSTSAAPAPETATMPANPPVPVARPSFTAAAQPATPKLDLPAKPSGKSTVRVPIAKIDTTVTATAAPAQTPAAAEPAQAAPPTPLQIVPSLVDKAVKAVGGRGNTQVASAEPAAATPAVAPASGGSYSVQLAAPGTEQEAQSASAKLQAKYAAELAGMQPAIHPAELNGRHIYRVRVGSLSKADAVSLCEKLKASGGDAACFVAKN